MYPMAVECSPDPLIQFIWIHFNCILQSLPHVFQLELSLDVFRLIFINFFLIFRT
jgi:hypothetical protein